jgi:homoserine acetyltransferase
MAVTAAAPGAGPHAGMATARSIGQISYRSELEFDERFGRDHPGNQSNGQRRLRINDVTGKQ